MLCIGAWPRVGREVTRTNRPAEPRMYWSINQDTIETATLTVLFKFSAVIVNVSTA